MGCDAERKKTFEYNSDNSRRITVYVTDARGMKNFQARLRRLRTADCDKTSTSETT